MTSTLREIVDAIRLPDRAAWTSPASAAHGPHDVVIVVPPDGDLERGLQIVMRELAEGRSVLMIARGVTIVPPRGACFDTPKLALAEIDAYLPNDKTPLLAAVQEPTSAWLRSAFRGAVAGVPVEKAFWSSAMMRFLRAPVSAAALALGIAHEHGAHHVILTDDWAGLATLERAMSLGGGRLVCAWAGRPRAPFAVTFGVHWAASLAGALLRRTAEFARQTAARERFFELREAHRKQPPTWITVTGHWPHSCRHVIESIGREASIRGEPIGVLLQYALESGAMDGGLRTRADATSLFPALQHPDLAPALVAVDQCASAESWCELAEVFVRATRASTKIALRLALSGSRLELGPIVVDARGDVAELARLATIDVVRAEEVRSATTRLVQRRSFQNARIAFSHASLAQVCIPDLMLQAAGAETFDVVHGALAEALDMVTSARTFSTTKLFWTFEEARYTAALLTPQHCRGGVPSRSLDAGARRQRRVAAPIRILALTNYGTRTGDRLVHLPRVAYQEHFFAALGALHDITAPYELRWRPHPGDDRSAVASTLEKHRDLAIALSQERSLDDDLAWADVVITSVSSVIVEALVHPVAVFVHDIPVHEASVILSMFTSDRLFRDRPSLALALQSHASARGDVSALEAERALRSRFFGPSERPGSLANLLFTPRSPSDVGAQEA